VSDVLICCQLQRLKSGELTWRCGVCGRGVLGLAPAAGDKCRVCGAVVEDAPRGMSGSREVPFRVLVREGKV
jgi:hypothetical protein